MSALDDLLAQRAAGAVPTLAPAAGASAPAAADLDTMLAARAGGAQVAAPPPAPRTLGQDFSDFATAAGHHVLKLVDGVGQLGEHAITGALNLLPDNPVSRAMTVQNAKDDRQSSDWEAGYQKAVPNGPAATAGAITGEVAPFLLEAPVKGLQWVGNGAEALGRALLPQAAAKVGGKLASGAAQGAVVGAAQPVVNTPSLGDVVTGNTPPGYWQQKADQVGMGAAFGTVMPAATSAAGAAWNGVKDLAAPIVNPLSYAGRQIGIQLGADAPAIAGDLAAAPTYVPGSLPTSAQAGADPRLVMMEKALANQNPAFKAQLAARENANNAARLDAVGNVAQTPDALAAALEKRSAVTGPMRDFAVTNGNPVPVGNIQGALGSLEGGPLGVRPTIGGAASAMRSELGDFTTVTPADTLTNTPGSATASPAMLDALRQNANDYLSKFAPQGFVGTQEQAAMTPIKSAIVDAIDAANPGHKLSGGGWGEGLEQAGPVAPSYRDYLTEFAKRSVPINTMEVGQQLQSKLLSGGLNSAGDAATALPGYRSALAQALRNSDFAIDPAAQAALEGVQSDLQRATISNSIRSSGSDTAYNAGAGKAFLRALGAADESNLPAAVAGGATLAATGNTAAAVGASVGAKKAGGWVTNRVGNSLGELLLDPQKLAAELQAQVAAAAQTKAAPASAGRLTGKLTPALAAAIALQLQQAQAPQVVGADAR